MSDRTRELARLAPFWKELRDQWQSWIAAQKEIPLSAEAQAYFIRLTFAVFREALDSTADAAEVPRPSPEDAWAHVLDYFHEKRPQSGKYIMDDIFKAAQEKALKAGVDAAWDRLDVFLGWVINQFSLRVREAAVNGYLPEHGKKSLRRATTSGDKTIGTASSDEESSTTLFDLLAKQDTFSTEAERGELQGLGEKWGTVFFPSVRDAFRLTLFLRLLRVDRGIIIACTDPQVMAAAGVGKSVLSSGYDNTRKQWQTFEDDQPEWPELDRVAQVFVDGVGWTHVLDHSESWFWSEKTMATLYPLLKERLG